MDPMLLADAVMVAHLGYVGFVIFGYVTVPLGGAMGWPWVRNRVFRLAHLAAIAFVALEAMIGMVCPLTVLENALRRAGEGRTFVGWLVASVLYYDISPWVFTVAYLALTVLAIALLWVVPIRPREHGAKRSSG